MSDSALVIIITVGMLSVVAIVALFLGRGFQARMTNKNLSVNVPPDIGHLAPPWYHAGQSGSSRLDVPGGDDADNTHKGSVQNGN